jgi:hypothetical protein
LLLDTSLLLGLQGRQVHVLLLQLHALLRLL